jgi:hypothetical protein
VHVRLSVPCSLCRAEPSDRCAQGVGHVNVRGGGRRLEGGHRLRFVARVFCVCVVALSAAHSCATAALTSMMPAVSPPSAPLGYPFPLFRMREAAVA